MNAPPTIYNVQPSERLMLSNAQALRFKSIRGFLWMDLQRHRVGYIVGMSPIALVVLVLGLLENVGGVMFFWMGLALAVSSGLGLARREWDLGDQVESLALPATRLDLHLARFALGSACLAALFVCCMGAGPLGWVRALRPFVPIPLPDFRPDAPIWAEFNGPGFYLLSIGLSLAVFTEFFFTSINAERRKVSSWIAGITPFCIGALLILAADYHWFVGQVGYLSGAAGLAYVIPRTYFSIKSFERKGVALDGSEPVS